MKIHETAIVHPEATIDSTVEIGPWCRVGPDVKIGADTKLISHVVVEGNTSIGERNLIHPFAVVGGAPQDLKYSGENTEVIIGDDNTIRESVTINLGTVGGGGKTVVGSHNLLMACVHLGHDCILGDHNILAVGTGLAGHVFLDGYVTLGGQVGVSQFVRVGAHAYIGGQSGLEKDVPPYCIAMGSRPMVIKGANIVGLRRRGFEVETIQKINEAIKLWVRPDVTKEQCLLEIESQYSGIPEIDHFVKFIRDSRSGVVK
ncbi:MAG: UDP-N-acetylglucosamine O-acyltransferase [Bdellovibrionaceae bacterium]|nr:UDP-N-acetylglucosamine O-acyltransferase [Pseudobdellovibrionaceae bacterium]|tara:strand:- start:1806 stop:2582 length:777 start_codon:yes stop_codon:yes gene_type:complete